MDNLRGVREYVPEGLNVCFEAAQRKGKTLAMVIFAVDAYQRGRTVHSNIQLGFGYERLHFRDLQLEENNGGRTRFWNGHICIDELNFYFDCRNSMSKANKKFSAFLLQQKKQGCNLTGTTHMLESLDLRYRANYDLLITPEVFPKYPAKPEYIKLHIENGPQQDYINKTLKLPAAPYLGLYDSFATHDPFIEAV